MDPVTERQIVAHAQNPNEQGIEPFPVWLSGSSLKARPTNLFIDAPFRGLRSLLGGSIPPTTASLAPKRAQKRKLKSRKSGLIPKASRSSFPALIPAWVATEPRSALTVSTPQKVRGDGSGAEFPWETTKILFQFAPGAETRLIPRPRCDLSARRKVRELSHTAWRWRARSAPT